MNLNSKCHRHIKICQSIELQNSYVANIMDNDNKLKVFIMDNDTNVRSAKNFFYFFIVDCIFIGQINFCHSFLRFSALNSYVLNKV